MEKACVWWIQRHICCHCLSPQSPPTPGQMCLYAVVGVASLPAALPMHSSVEAHSSFQLHQIQWRYSSKYPFRLVDIYNQPFIFLNIRKLSSFVWSWWLPWSLKRLRQKEVPSRWWKTGQLFKSEQHFIIFKFSQNTRAPPSTTIYKLQISCRGGSKGSGSRGSGRSNHPSGDDNDDGLSGSGIKTDKPPCVGLCYYNKLHGLPIETTTPR